MRREKKKRSDDERWWCGRVGKEGSALRRQGQGRLRVAVEIESKSSLAGACKLQQLLLLLTKDSRDTQTPGLTPAHASNCTMTRVGGIDVSEGRLVPNKWLAVAARKMTRF